MMNIEAAHRITKVSHYLIRKAIKHGWVKAQRPDGKRDYSIDIESMNHAINGCNLVCVRGRKVRVFNVARLKKSFVGEEQFCTNAAINQYLDCTRQKHPTSIIQYTKTNE